MIPVIEEIILTCLILTGAVQISDNVTLVCQPPAEGVEEVNGEESEDRSSDASGRRSVSPSGGFVPLGPSSMPEDWLRGRQR